MEVDDSLAFNFTVLGVVTVLVVCLKRLSVQLIICLYICPPLNPPSLPLSGLCGVRFWLIILFTCLMLALWFNVMFVRCVLCFL